MKLVLFTAMMTCGCLYLSTRLIAEEPPTTRFAESFENGSARWEPTDAKAWEVVALKEGGHAYHLIGNSQYKPPHRSPFNISLIKEHAFGDFELTARVKTLQTSRGHRDMCLFFGYQDPAHFYYVHLGEKADPHSNQIFIVNDAPRTAISEQTSEGTPWKDDTWHQVKLVRKLKDGRIEVYFDDMKSPQMVAHDQHFGAGRVGVGSFDDFGLWDDVEIHSLDGE
ncbi:MAG: hypothetical protein KDA80_01410 [Planctomycetaceae bacterium]|nr:hypothetical protein [Planctomycetaceae bacterium]